MRLSGRKSSSLSRRWTQQQRFVLLALIGINCGAFVAQLIATAADPNFVAKFLGLSYRGIDDAYAWQFFTAMFLHDGAWHFVGNMLLLYLIGRDVESILGQRHFLYLYLLGAIFGELGHLFLMPYNSVLLGAFGGVAAIVVAYATILPELELTSAIPLRIKAKHLAYGAFAISALLLVIDRHGTVIHSACIGGCVAGYLYAHLLGFGRPSMLQRAMRQRRAQIERYQQMSAEQFISEEIDPLLEKISRNGIGSLTRTERRVLARAKEKFGEKTETE